MSLIDSIKNNIFSIRKKCVYCGKEKPNPEYICFECSEKLKQLLCEGNSLYYYFDVVRKVCHNFKYNEQPYIGEYMAQEMAESIISKKIDFDIITFVPIHKKRRSGRGYDQSEILAKHIAQILGKPFLPTLARIRNTSAQFSLGAAERAKNISNAFEIYPNINISGKKLLIIDDIYTTGSTINECTKTINAANADADYFTFAKEEKESVHIEKFSK